jgi:hypothetical protein
MPQIICYHTTMSLQKHLQAITKVQRVVAAWLSGRGKSRHAHQQGDIENSLLDVVRCLAQARAG